MVKKLLSIVALMLCIVMVFGACGENGTGDTTSTGGTSSTGNATGTSGIKGLDKDGNWIKVEKVSKPDYKSGTMTLEEFENTYRAYTDWRIYEIRTTKSEVKPANGGTAYYVSNKGSIKNDGLTPETPVGSYANIISKLKSKNRSFLKRIIKIENKKAYLETKPCSLK